MNIRSAVEQDADAITGIYNHYVLNTIATFEDQAVSAAEMARRICQVLSLPLPWLVVEADRRVVGYAYATRWRTRHAYRFSAESTIYLMPGQESRGIGTQLYGALFSQLRDSGIHAVMAGISLPNPASIALHEKLGMSQAAHFEAVGFKFDRWVDVGYWQILL